MIFFREHIRDSINVLAQLDSVSSGEMAMAYDQLLRLTKAACVLFRVDFESEYKKSRGKMKNG